MKSVTQFLEEDEMGGTYMGEIRNAYSVVVGKPE
jgi:hypothetical protein